MIPGERNVCYSEWIVNALDLETLIFFSTQLDLNPESREATPT